MHNKNAPLPREHARIKEAFCFFDIGVFQGAFRMIPETDDGVSSVMKRADARMYENKKKMKATI